ncbi:hypothetical protein ID866_11165 [Astraeus odoratus]|nr:hypothetical protein ID866_11165 [Astraeus odoratus]
MSTATIHQALPMQINQAKAKSQAEHTMEDWELVLEASLDLNSEDNEATASLQKKVKEDRMAVRTAERRSRGHRQRQSKRHRKRQEAEWKKEEEEKAQRSEEAKKRAEEAEQVAEMQRRTAERQCKLSMVIPTGGSSHRSASETPTQEDDKEDNEEDDETEGEGNFVVPLALAQEHRDALGALTTTLSMLLKEFKGFCHEQWDLQAHQVKGLKALQKEMKTANALKAKSLRPPPKARRRQWRYWRSHWRVARKKRRSRVAVREELPKARTKMESET